MKKEIKIIFATLLLCCMSSLGFSQDIDARSPKPNGGSSQQVKADKKKEKQKAMATKAIEKGKKRHEKLQAKNTKKMMKKSKKKSKQWNQNKKDFFLKRWFTRKHH